MTEPNPSQPLRIGVLGTARIARKFIAGVRPSNRVLVTSVASRDAARAAQFAMEMNIGRRFESYESLIRDPDIDAVYNPLPNSMHAEWSIRAIKAGKHVLCEKPLSGSEHEARTMFEAAQHFGVHLVEGFPYRAQPQTLKLQEIVQSGRIGKVRQIQATFAFTLVDREDIRLRPDLAGGALMDLGTYPVNLVRLVAGSRPARVRAVARWNGHEDRAVDRTLVALLEFEDGPLAQVMCSFDAAQHREALIVGSNGTIHTTYQNHTSPEIPGDLTVREGLDASGRGITINTPSTNGFLAEAESFAAMVGGGMEQWTGSTVQESIDNAAILEALQQSARSGGAAVDLTERTRVIAGAR